MTGNSTFEPCSHAELMAELNLTPNRRSRTAVAAPNPARPETRYADELIGGSICPVCGSAIDESEAPPFHCGKCRTLFLARERT